MEELEAAIAKIYPGKAPGPDVIFCRMVQHFGNLATKELLEIFNLSWATGKLPKIWKLSTVIPILKPNKNSSECKNYIQANFPHHPPLQAHGTGYPP
ncbi:hypothetical protein TNCV_3363641 [Trichonephila clavipes]|nr:hypothetical protein TNCV_3363641 [Trichonephila clavipes]